MKKTILYYIGCYLLGCIVGYAIYTCIDNNKINDSINIEYIDTLQNSQIDTVLYTKQIDSLQNVINDIQLDIDSYQAHTDSIADELLVAQYKLERIKYYNSIATGTNLNFLRGWINRVLNN